MGNPRRKNKNGQYVIKGRIYGVLKGTRAKVFHQTAFETTGGLTKGQLIMNKNGRIVSKKKHETSKREKRLEKHGFTAKKGKFGAVKIEANSRKSRKRSKSRKSRKSRK